MAAPFLDEDVRSSSPDSLFDSPGPDHSSEPHSVLASRTAPPIPGLYLPHARLPNEFASSLLTDLKNVYFPPSARSSNQVMLFGTTMFPPQLLNLLSTLSTLLRPPALPPNVYTLLFPPDADQRGHARQAIINMYKPGEGITPHVDLLERYGDGIVGVSLGSGCAMRFRQVREGKLRRSGVEEPDEGGEDEEREVWDVWLPERSVVVMSGEARYGWTHGIERVERDWVEGEETGQNEWVERGERVSVTLRWLLPGAMVVGEPE